jgi:hypothetical protein
MQAAAGDAKRAAVENTLHLNRWRRRSVVAGVGIAEDLGIDRDALCDALDERVNDQCERPDCGSCGMSLGGPCLSGPPERYRGHAGPSIEAACERGRPHLPPPDT